MKRKIIVMTGGNGRFAQVFKKIKKKRKNLLSIKKNSKFKKFNLN